MSNSKTEYIRSSNIIDSKQNTLADDKSLTTEVVKIFNKEITKYINVQKKDWIKLSAEYSNEIEQLERKIAELQGVLNLKKSALSQVYNNLDESKPLLKALKNLKPGDKVTLYSDFYHYPNYYPFWEERNETVSVEISPQYQFVINAHIYEYEQGVREDTTNTRLGIFHIHQYEEMYKFMHTLKLSKEIKNMTVLDMLKAFK